MFSATRMACWRIAKPSPRNRGFGFQVRHLDFHPTRPWGTSRSSGRTELQMPEGRRWHVERRGVVFEGHAHDPAHVHPGQTTSSIHVHPNGRFVYLGNRSAGTTKDGVFAGGENSIAVFQINQTITGEPDAHPERRHPGIHPTHLRPRRFGTRARRRESGLASSGARDGNSVTTAPGGLTVFTIQSCDGKLEFVKKHDPRRDRRQSVVCSGWEWSRCRDSYDWRGRVRR